MRAGEQAEPNWVAGVREVQTWVHAAQPGDTMVYARRPSLPAGSATAELARKLAQRGEIALHFSRDAEGNPQYLMRRKAKVCGKPLLAPAASRTPEGDAARVLRVLTMCVEQQRVCPPNLTIAQITGVLGADRVSYAMRQLAAAGLIESQIVDPGAGTRIVTLKHSGRSTRDPRVAVSA